MAPVRCSRIDYVIADKHVLPRSQQKNWTEEIVHLPHSYYPNERKRPLPKAPTPQGHATHGLPDTGFVFCCFNNNYKVTPEIFALWMRLLREVPGSVLWLYQGNKHAPANLLREAERAGIDPSRLIFAKPLPLNEHIDRHAYADLFLDTMPYNAHTTGADALWAGVPLVTLCGQSFASRVGASLLHAVGLPELICETPEAYVDVALALVRNPAILADLRRKLVAARKTSTLFDAALFAADLERAYLEMAKTS